AARQPTSSCVSLISWKRGTKLEQTAEFACARRATGGKHNISKILKTLTRQPLRATTMHRRDARPTSRGCGEDQDRRRVCLRYRSRGPAQRRSAGMAKTDRGEQGAISRSRRMSSFRICHHVTARASVPTVDVPRMLTHPAAALLGLHFI